MSKRLSLAIISEPGKGGVKTHLVDLLSHIDLDHLQVTYYHSLRRSDETYKDEIAALRERGIECVELPMDARLNVLENLKTLTTLIRLLRRKKPEVLHLHSSKAGGLGRLASLFLHPRPKVLYTPHAMACYRSRVYLWLERLLGVLTDTLVAVSASEKQDFIRWRIPKASEAETITLGMRAMATDFQNRVAEQSTPWVVGSCGRICAQKNALFFFQVALETLRRHSEYRFKWIGDFGDDQEAQAVRVLLDKAGHPPQIEVTGWVADSTAQLRTLNVFCMFSRYESFGYVTAEAMQVGVPVLALAASGTVDLVQHESTGLLVDADLASVAKGLDLLQSDLPLRTRLVANAKRLIDDHYTIAKMVEASRALYFPKGPSNAHRPARIRVAVVCEPGIAGVKTHVMDILQNIDLKRFEVHYFYSRTRSDKPFSGEVIALQTRGIVCRELPMAVELRPGQDLFALLQLYRALRSFRPEILHLHSSKASGLGRLAALFLRPHPCVIYTPNAMACYRSKTYHFLERWLGHFTDILVAVSASEKRDFIDWKIPKGEDAFVLTVGVRDVAGLEKAVTSEKWVIGACGRICYQKNALLFFHTALAMAAKDPTLEFRWIGEFADDEEAEEVRTLLASAQHPPQIVITGWVSDPHRAMSALDTFCMFSRYESFGYVTADAMLLDVPVVALASTGTKDLVLHEETGLITNSNQSQVAADLRRIREDISLRERLTKRAHDRIRQVYTVAGMVKQMEQLYAEWAARP